MESQLTDGFDEASDDVQQAILENYTSDVLAAEIADMLGMEQPRSGQLNKQHKAAIIRALR